MIRIAGKNRTGGSAWQTVSGNRREVYKTCCHINCIHKHRRPAPADFGDCGTKGFPVDRNVPTLCVKDLTDPFHERIKEEFLVNISQYAAYRCNGCDTILQNKSFPQPVHASFAPGNRPAEGCVSAYICGHNVSEHFRNIVFLVLPAPRVRDGPHVFDQRSYLEFFIQPPDPAKAFQ